MNLTYTRPVGKPNVPWKLATSNADITKGLLQMVLESEPSAEILIETKLGKQEKVADGIDKIGKVKHVYKSIPYISIRAGTSEIRQLVNAVNDGNVFKSFRKDYGRILSDIKSVELSFVISVPGFEKESLKKASMQQGQLWNLEQIGAYEAQKISTGYDVSVAVIDTGIDFNHPDLKQNFGFEKGYDFVNGGELQGDDNGHGTHVAGLVAGARTGVAIDARLYGLKALDGEGGGYESDSIAAVDWAIQKPVDVINMSLGSPMYSEAFRKICDYAAEQGIIIVAAAGNNYSGANYPAAFGDSVIAVAGTTKDKRKADFSNVWYTNDISAPATDIISTYPGNQLAYMTGTSMSCPETAGTVAIAVPYLRTRDIESAMKDTAEKLQDDPSFEYNEGYGAGLIRADKMLNTLSALPETSRPLTGRPLVQRVKHLLWN